MGRPLVFDASALLAVYFQEVGAAFAIDLMREAESEKYMHGVNACEVAYKLIKRGCPPARR